MSLSPLPAWVSRANVEQAENEMKEISLANGKYKLRRFDNGALVCLRHNEPWRDLTGDKLIGCMFDEIVNLRAALYRLLHEDMQNDITPACQQAREALGET